MLQITVAALTVAGAAAFADDPQSSSQSQKPAESAATSGCPGMMGTGMMKGMHGMMGPDGKGPGMMNAMPMGMGMMRPGLMMAGTPEMVEARLATLKAELAITEPQTEAWSAYAGALKTRANTMQSMHASTMQAMQAGTAVDRLDAHITHMRAMLDAMTALKPAMEGLYKVLAAEQRKKADSLIGAGCGLM
jgi:hypothetical protein